MLCDEPCALCLILRVWTRECRIYGQLSKTLNSFTLVDKA